MNMNTPDFMGGMAIGGAVGAVCGLLPLSIAMGRKRIDLAVAAMIACITAGIIMNFCLALPAAVIITAAIYAFTSRPRERDSEDALNYTMLDREIPEPVDVQRDTALGDQPAQPRVKKVKGAAVRCTGCGWEFWPGLGPTPPWCKQCGADLRPVETAPSETPSSQTATADTQPAAAPVLQPVSPVSDSPPDKASG